MKHTVFVIVCMVLSAYTFAQTTEMKAGYTKLILTVKDAKGDPIADKKVRLVNTDLSVTKEANTDTAGMVTFEGKVNSNYALYFGNGNVPQTFFIPTTPYQEFEIPIIYDPLQSEKIVPSANEVLLNISLVDFSMMPLSKSITFENKVTKQKYAVTTDTKGVGQILVPKGVDLIVHFKEAPDYSILPIPAQGGIIYNYTMKFSSNPSWKKFPSNTMGLINFIFTDLNGNLVAGETFTVTTASNPAIYTCKTDANGFAQVLVPLGFQYTLSQLHNPGFKNIIVNKLNPSDAYIINVDYIFITEAQRKEREELRLRMAKIRDSIAAANPSLYNYSINVNQLAGIENSGENYTKKLAKDPDIFIKDQKTVLAVLNRFRIQWKSKIIVVDVTGSMSPYMSQVGIWMVMQKMQNETNRYVFFNDGDQKWDAQKTVGNTGGIYTIKSNNLQDVFIQMSIAQSKGSGGDSPENDVEALIMAESLRNDVSEIILVADNYSDMRDYALIKQLKIPVRVIVCGALDAYSVNEQYINLAYKTGGSIHTLTEDIMDLAKKNDGDTITVSGKKYVLRNGEFFLIQ
ncbi:carboxypeptidase-like regulatory domain-containing protein [Cytophaga aurantiaca]|uniref:carboxypeptidase-like regulatory domain-containing protein n=1 Tax=Cytophaga aurantiaca TaxID=29530 RepID=UPI0003712B2A|nr:carboxypeptidase-like regulatory domain-containing protein [Cytophaga aurantiaca]